MIFEGRFDKEEACDTIVWACIIEQQRKNEKEIHHGLKQAHTNEFPHNNQPKIGFRNGGEYGREVQQLGGVGERDTIVFGGGEVKGR